jgi:plastocyanin
MRKLLATLALVGLLAALAVAVAGPASGSDAHSAATKIVTVRDNYFSPKTITVPKKTLVKFQWGKGGKGTEVEHNVTGVKGETFHSKDLSKGTYSHRFKKTTTVYCTVHPTTMKLVVKVK